MKKLYTFLILAFTVVVSNAQIVNIPDAAFKAKLLAASATEYIAFNSANTEITIDTNSDGEIQDSEALTVYKLYVDSSTITDLTGIASFTNLHELYCTNNMILSLSINSLVNLERLDCSNNQLTSLDLAGLTKLYFIWASYNQLSTIDLTHYTVQNDALDVNFSHNLLTSVNLAEHYAQGFGALVFDYNLLENLSLHSNEIGDIISCVNNPNLTTLILKDAEFGVFSEGSIRYENCPNLRYICVREQYFTNAQYLNSLYGYTNCEINSYCSFTPGGTFYTIQGNTRLDQNNNGCDNGDAIYPNMKFSITNGTTTGFFISNSSGNYSIPVVAGNYTITPVIENSTYYDITPSSVNVSFPTQTSPFVQNFCAPPNVTSSDLEITLLPLNNPIAGFNGFYKIIFKNKGNQLQSGSVNLAFDDTVMDLVSASPTNTSSSTNSLSWAFSNLQPLETREIVFTMNINSPFETPALNSGDIISYTATIIGVTDIAPNDNTSTIHQTVLNSYDPNDKTCIEGTTVSPNAIGQYVHYVVRFENTGTANAQNIVVKDIIDTSKYDINSLVPLSGSASFETRIKNTNQVEFIFENINLPFDDANNDGYVAFKIKTKPTLVLGDTFSNTANIYFDYNFPIVTNTATTTIATLGTQDFEFSTMFSLSPVPTKNILTITTKQTLEMSSISIYNTLGQLVQTVTNPHETVDVSELKSGTYFIKISSDKGTASSKFVKE